MKDDVAKLPPDLAAWFAALKLPYPDWQGDLAAWFAALKLQCDRDIINLLPAVAVDERIWDGPGLERWTNEWLDTIAGFAAERNAGLDEVHAEMMKERRREREAVDLAARVAALLPPELRTHQVLRQRKGRGRPAGADPRLAAADADVDRIVAIWQWAFGKRNRSQPPTAIDIAARRHGVDAAKLQTHRHNTPRLSTPEAFSS